MKISFNWLRELVDLPAGASAEDVARALTLAGLEVESIDRRGRDVTGVRVAEVRAIRPHPQAEKLRIVRVSLGAGKNGEDLEEDVVCGAPNVPEPGGRVAWAPPGATLPGGLTLSRKAIRGVDSPGMLCSERELGLGDAASGVDGILILSTEHALGADVAGILGVADDVFEVNVTPNRADALSHVGIAREVAGLFGVTWRLPPLSAPPSGGAVVPAVTVEIADASASPRYQATVIRGLRVGPSPVGMRVRLAACGVRAISNLVDVTNYVMLETGHPLHAFDLAKIERGIVVRRAQPGESLRTLDGVDRRLEPGDVVIADARGAVALAGVMGGADSEVTSSTTDVLLEAATFDPRSIRRTAKRLGLHSEASHRFERGVDAAGVAVAGARAAALLVKVGGGGGVVAGEPVDRQVAQTEPRQVTLSLATLRRIAGFDIAPEQAVDKLRGIEIPVEVRGSELVATVPSFRPDVVIEEDLVEEVMRLVGYDAAPVRLPSGGRAPDPSPERTADRARDLLAALGLNEIAGWAFVPRASLAALGVPALAQGVAVSNPISADYEVMRTSLLPGLLDAARRNLSRGIGDLGLFEVGPLILPAEGPGDGGDHHQSNWAAGVLIGRRAAWMKPGEPVDFFDLKRVVSQFLAGLGVPDPTFTAVPAGAHLPYHPGVSAEIRRASEGDGPPLGRAGELHPRVARRLGIEAPVFAFELSIDALEGLQSVVRAAPPPRFPSVTRDISFWADAAVPAREQQAAFLAAGETLLREVAVLEDFREPKFVPAGKKGMLWTLTYRSDERTLTDAEVDAAHARVVAALGRAFSIEIR